MSSFGPHLKIIGLCYYANVVKKEKSQILTTHKTFKKSHNFPQTEHQLQPNINRKFIFELQKGEWDLSSQ